MANRTSSASIIQDIAKFRSLPDSASKITFTITALVPRIGSVLPRKFTPANFNNIHDAVILHIPASKIPEVSRCSCLGEQEKENDGFNRTCLSAGYMVLDYGSDSKLCVSANGKAPKYDGYRKGGEKMIYIDEAGGQNEWVECVEDVKG